MILSGRQIKEALEFVNPDGDHNPSQLDDELTFEFLEGAKTPLDDNTHENLPDGIYVCLTDYPEEGWMGPLGMA